MTNEVGGSVATDCSTAIPWRDVALVGFANGRAVVITSAEPDMFLTGAMMADEDEDDDLSAHDLLDRVQQLEWKLFKIDDAKRVFAESHVR